MNAGLLLAMALLLLVSCSITHPQQHVDVAPTAAPSRMQTSQTNDDAPHAPSPQAGALVQGTSVYLPTHAAAGATIEGQAPPGSTVESNGQRITVGDDGRFQLRMPDDAAHGPLKVRILRPGKTPLVLQVRLDPHL